MQVFIPDESSLLLTEIISTQLEILLHAFKTTDTQQTTRTTRFSLA